MARVGRKRDVGVWECARVGVWECGSGQMRGGDYIA